MNDLQTYLAKKRFRQASIQECFGSQKKFKVVSSEGHKMNDLEKLVKRELLATAAEKRIEAGNSSKDKKCEVDQDLTNSDSSTYETSQNSEDLFPESSSVPQLSPKPSSFNITESQQEQIPFHFNKTPDCCGVLSPLHPSPDHTILFRVPLKDDEVPHPFPKNYIDKWDSDYVRMPCSPENLYPIKESGKVENRWSLIQRSLSRNFTSSYDLEEAILEYNSQYADRWDFRGLHSFFSEVLDEAESLAFFRNILPGMVRLSLQLPQICTQPIPLLKRQKNHAITLSQKQIGCLLANAFFCTFPRRNAQKRGSEYSSYPDINFNRLYIGCKEGITKRKAGKLKCLLNYFRRIIIKEPVGTVTFERRGLQDLPPWSKSKKALSKLHVQTSGLIEKEGEGMLQVDFANKRVGGGVLGQGCVQEEIRFIICPELIVSRLFTECLGIAEVLIMTGCEQYNQHSGYGDNFIWDGDFHDRIPRDMWRRKYTQIVAMDALHFRISEQQYDLSLIRRELNKAYCGFYEPNQPTENLPAVATGNWGCGAFKGDPQLKALIQLMAASEAERSIVYFTFGNEQLKKDVKHMYSYLVKKNLKVGDLWLLLEHCCHTVKRGLLNLYDCIYEIDTEYLVDTDTDDDQWISLQDSHAKCDAACDGE